MDGEFLPVPNPTHAKFCTMPESAHPGWRITNARDRNFFTVPYQTVWDLPNPVAIVCLCVLAQAI